MAYTLTGSRYIGSGALPTPTVGYDLIDIATGNFYMSNTASSAWMLAGNTNNVNLGTLPVTGGTMNGVVTGTSLSTSTAPVDAPLMTGSAKINGIPLATSANLTGVNSITAELIGGLTSKINESITATAISASLKENTKIETGFFQFGATSLGDVPQTIPLPVYPDGTTAKESDCKWFCTIIGSSLRNASDQNINPNTGNTVITTTERAFLPNGLGGGAPNDNHIMARGISSLTSRTIGVQNFQVGAPMAAYGCLVWYMIIAVRK